MPVWCGVNFQFSICNYTITEKIEFMQRSNFVVEAVRILFSETKAKLRKLKLRRTLLLFLINIVLQFDSK